MNYKALFNRTFLLISSPARAWEEISLETDRRSVFTDFVYPMIGLCGLSVFLGSLFTLGWSGPESFRIAMTRCCSVAVSLFGGYFLAASLIQRIGQRVLHMECEKGQVMQLAGYSMVMTFVLKIVLGVLPDFRIIALLVQFYVVYIVWEGSDRLMQTDESKRLHFTLATSLLLLLCPFLIEWVFNELNTLLN